jgi:hypothetical protein
MSTRQAKTSALLHAREVLGMMRSGRRTQAAQRLSSLAGLSLEAARQSLSDGSWPQRIDSTLQNPLAQA